MPNNADSHQCKYTDSDGKSCSRTTTDNHDYCLFHYGCDFDENEKLPLKPEFQSALELLVAEKDGLWNGFVFPENFVFPRNIDFTVSVHNARFISLHLRNVVFENKVDFSDSIFIGDTIFQRLTFKGNALFNQCQFNGCLEILYTHFNQASSFLNAVFSKQTLFKVNFQQNCSFHGAIFKEGVAFSGWDSHTGKLGFTIINIVKRSPLPFLPSKSLLSLQNIKIRMNNSIGALKNLIDDAVRYIKGIPKKANRLYQSLHVRFSSEDKDLTKFDFFEKGGRFTNVIFLKPRQVLLSQVDLSKTLFNETDLRGVRFQGVTWIQPKLKRNGLYDEVAMLSNKNKASRLRQLPSLEDTCRNARLALEENKDFNTASDFYIGEMEMLRAQLPFLKRHFFSVVFWYKVASQYGTSVFRAFFVLFIIFFLHYFFTLFNTSFTLDFEIIIEKLMRTIKVLTLQVPLWRLPTPESSVFGVLAQEWVDTIFRICVPIQFTMLILAFRSRIKRY